MVKLLSSLASLAWPIIFAVALYHLFISIKSLIESARSRKFTAKVAGNELSMDEASEQQRIILSVLQVKVSQIEKKLNESQFSDVKPEPEIPRTNKKILWVDDRPSNNSYLAAAIEDRGASVITALNTKEALKILKEEQFDIVISDMGRPEGDHAGMDLTRKIKKRTQIYPCIYIVEAELLKIFSPMPRQQESMELHPQPLPFLECFRSQVKTNILFKPTLLRNAA